MAVPITMPIVEWLPIEYGAFWDAPRMILVRDAGRLLFLDCPFDEADDDYPDRYTVYELPPDHYGFREGDWTPTPAGARLIGYLPVKAIKFDETRRRALTAASLRDNLTE